MDLFVQILLKFRCAHFFLFLILKLIKNAQKYKPKTSCFKSNYLWGSIHCTFLFGGIGIKGPRANTSPLFFYLFRSILYPCIKGIIRPSAFENTNIASTFENTFLRGAFESSKIDIFIETFFIIISKTLLILIFSLALPLLYINSNFCVILML